MYYIIVELWYDAPFMGRVCFDILSLQIIMSTHPYQISMYLSSYCKTCLGVAGYSLTPQFISHFGFVKSVRLY